MVWCSQQCELQGEGGARVQSGSSVHTVSVLDTFALLWAQGRTAGGGGGADGGGGCGILHCDL